MVIFTATVCSVPKESTKIELILTIQEWLSVFLRKILGEGGGGNIVGTRRLEDLAVWSS